MLRSVRDLQNRPLVDPSGERRGLVKDLYFDDQTWSIRYFVVVPSTRLAGQKQVLLTPEQLLLDDQNDVLRLTIAASEFSKLPLANSVQPVCKQYESISLSSPGSQNFRRHAAAADPFLRSARVVSNYGIFVGSEFVGTLSDLLYDDGNWAIRHLAAEQVADGRTVRFHIVPEAVKRFTWATQRVVLHKLQPVTLEPQVATVVDEAAA